MRVMEIAELRALLIEDLKRRGYTLRMVPLQGMIHIPDLQKTVSIENVRIEFYQKHKLNEEADFLCYGFCLMSGEKGYWIEESNS